MTIEWLSQLSAVRINAVPGSTFRGLFPTAGLRRETECQCQLPVHNVCPILTELHYTDRMFRTDQYYAPTAVYDIIRALNTPSAFKKIIGQVKYLRRVNNPQNNNNKN